MVTQLVIALVMTAVVTIPLSAQCPDGNLTHDTAYAYLSDGLASEIATSLARVPRLEVRSPGAVRGAQRGIASDPRVVGRRLNVRYVVEGDFQRGGERIRCAARRAAVPASDRRESTAGSEMSTAPIAILDESAVRRLLNSRTSFPPSPGRSPALRWLSRAVEERSFPMVFARVDPIWDPLRDDPRFVDLLGRIRPADR